MQLMGNWGDFFMNFVVFLQIGMSAHQILVVMVASALIWWPTLFANVLITGKARHAPSVSPCREFLSPSYFFLELPLY